jgi:hypothetical protein
MMAEILPPEVANVVGILYRTLTQTRSSDRPTQDKFVEIRGLLNSA